MIHEVRLRPLQRPDDDDALISFLSSNSYPFHMRSSPSAADIKRRLDQGAFSPPENVTYWVLADGERVGVAVLEDLEDDTPMFDLRLAEDARGQGVGVQALRALTDEVFDNFPDARRFEGQTREDNVAMRRTFLRAGWVKEAHYREGWPVEQGAPLASVAYAILRRDWVEGTSTRVPWDDEP
jgi:RimJ/RimL family protein N-acetyltransferase